MTPQHGPNSGLHRARPVAGHDTDRNRTPCLLVKEECVGAADRLRDSEPVEVQYRFICWRGAP